ncbi:unnamed protein product [Nyctereutes procyonoides]|uniref:Large ribosomal subunit protein uL29 n=1 Tax=Nyctereutes procyonoides TaxID=34880 RepID=A0A811YXR6_NYCPR|nr:unnamed protein product [Nyctereutes procyonoides]
MNSKPLQHDKGGVDYKQVEDLKVELSHLCIIKATGNMASKLSKIQPRTSGNSTRVRYKPLDVWPKKACAMRLRLNKQEENLKTKKQ